MVKKKQIRLMHWNNHQGRPMKPLRIKTVIDNEGIPSSKIYHYIELRQFPKSKVGGAIRRLDVGRHHHLDPATSNDISPCFFF
jgi:predicted DNA-binding transcriptional regulator AlpA